MFESEFLKSYLVVTCFIATCLVFLIILPSLLRWRRNKAQLAPIHRVVHCLADWLRSQRRDRDFQLVHTDELLSRKNSFTTDMDDVPTVVASDITETTEAGHLTSPLSTKEREARANPFGVSGFQQAAANGSQQRPASSSSVINLCQTFNVGSCGKLTTRCLPQTLHVHC